MRVLLLSVSLNYTPTLRQTCILIKDDLAMGDWLGEGSFGKVTAATYCGMQVAVKTLKVTGFPDESDLANFR